MGSVRLAALALVPALLLAGCLSPSPAFAREQASAAPAATEQALGPGGAARAQLVVLRLDDPAVRIGVEGETVYHQGDAWTTTLRYTRLEGEGGNLTAAAQAARIAIACTPERVVVRVADGEGLGLKDADAETANPVAACRPAPADAEAFRAAVQRVLADNPRLAAELTAVSGDRSFPRMALKDAQWQRDGTIHATYDATEGDRTVPLDAVVRDARLQRTHAVVEADGSSGEATVTYLYGERDPAPGWRGAATL
ncbi:MAG: hypothetical protein QOD77_1455 [Thermoplasmata archaeon]|jgi:hypothetical protein|nr:hypothetical protein [Thermoplasmata archaeon]